MKRIIISLLLSVVIWGVGLAQNTEPALRKIYVSSELGYSLSPASSSDGMFHTGVLSEGSVDINSLLPSYKFGGVPDQQIWNNIDFLGFYISTDTLGLSGADLSYTIDGIPEEKVHFNPSTGRFMFYPDSSDIFGFKLTLHAKTKDEYELTQDVYFGVVPSDGNMFTYLSDHKREVPDADNYFTIVKVDEKNGGHFNGENPASLISYSVSGVELRFGSSASTESSHDLSSLSEMKNLKELNIYGERVIFESPVSFYSTNVNIYANEVIFENGASVSTTSTDFAKSGDVNLYARKIIAERSSINFYMNADTIGKIKYNVPEALYTGNNGEYVDAPYGWLHSNWLLQLTNRLNDSFIDQQDEYVRLNCNFYTQQIESYRQSTYWKTDDIELLEVEAIANEIQSMNLRIKNNLDYFGNPQGFMPMLSFEVNQSLYKQEIDRSIKTLYFTYWMKNAGNTIEQRIAACKEALAQEKEQLAVNIVTANELSASSKLLQHKMETLVREMDEMTDKLNNEVNYLVSQAGENVAHKNSIDKVKQYVIPGIKIVTTSAILITGAVKGKPDLAGMAFDAGDFASETVETIWDWVSPGLDTSYGDAPGYEAFYNTLKSDASSFSGSVSSYSSMLNGVKMNDLGSRQGVMDVGKSFRESSATMLGNISKFQSAVSKTSVSNKEVQTELNKLIAESPIFTTLLDNVTQLNNKKENVVSEMFSTFNQLTTTVYAVQKGILTIDALNVSTFEQELTKDFKTMIYIENMEKNAKNRLLKSHYYMGRSYEYSFLEPYQISLNTKSLFEKCKSIVESASGSNLSAADFDALKEIYTKDLASVEDKIIETFNNNNVPQKKKIYYTLNKDQLNILNKDSLTLTANLFEDGKFPLSEVDIRILDIKVKSLKSEVNGTQVDPDRYFDLNLIHEGNSRFVKNGKIVGFTHKSNDDVKPIKWSFRCFQDGEVSKESMSPTSLSLLNSLLGKVVTGENVFAKPAAWGSLTFERRNDYNPDWMNINIKQMQLEIEYEAIPNSYKPVAFVSASNNLKPNIQLFVDELPTVVTNGFYAQTFENTYSQLRVKAPQQFGEWVFTSWVDQNGRLLSKDANYGPNYVSNNNYFKANYQKTQASLEVAPSYEVTEDKGYLTIKVENGGSKKLIWSVSDVTTEENTGLFRSALNNESWLQVKAGMHGVNDGSIVLAFDENSEMERYATLTIESNSGNKDIRITQSKQEVTTSIEENKDKNKDHVTVYVKDNGLCYVDIGELASSVQLEIYDLNGRVMKQVFLQDVRTFDVDISHLISGVYVFKISYDDKTWNQKIMKY